MSRLTALFSQYEQLEQTAQYLTTLDLVHLGSTCSALHALILKSETIFERLKRLTLCSGRGLVARQEFTKLYALQPEDFTWGRGRKAHYDEEVEVRVWNKKCDAADNLPCIKCNTNVCEVCYLTTTLTFVHSWSFRSAGTCLVCGINRTTARVGDRT